MERQTLNSTEERKLQRLKSSLIINARVTEQNKSYLMVYHYVLNQLQTIYDNFIIAQAEGNGGPLPFYTPALKRSLPTINCERFTMSGLCHIIRAVSSNKLFISILRVKIAELTGDKFTELQVIDFMTKFRDAIINYAHALTLKDMKHLSPFVESQGVFYFGTPSTSSLASTKKHLQNRKDFLSETKQLIIHLIST